MQAWRAGCAALLAVGSALLPVPAAAPPLRWVVADFAPGVIKDGPLQGQGYVDRLLGELLRPGLPQWRHQLSVGPTARVLRELQQDDSACTPALRKTPERARQLHFSQPMIRFLPVGLVLRRRDLAALEPLIDARGALSLSAYLAQRRPPRIGVMGGRAHGERIDALLQQHARQLQAINFNNSSQSLMTMVARGRSFDATIGFSFEPEYLMRLRPELAGRLAWLPLQEQPETLLGYMACARSLQGRQVVEAVDLWMARPGQRERAQALYEAWLDPASAERLRQMRQALRSPGAFWRD